MFVTSRALSINSYTPLHLPAWQMCCKCSSNVQKSTVTILVICIYMCMHMYVHVHCPLQCLCRCRRKISQLIEYLKLPNRNFKFITHCRQATGHIQANCRQAARQPVERPFNGHYLLDVWLSALSHSFLPSLALGMV